MGKQGRSQGFLGHYASGKVGDNRAMTYEGAFFGLGLTDVNVAGADVSVSLSQLLGIDAVSLSLEGSVLNKHKAVSEQLTADGCKKYTYMNSTSRIYMVWQDDRGDFHAIYEYNPKK